MKFYQSPLLLFASVLILSAVFYVFRFMLDKNSWGLLYALPALIIGGSSILLYFLLRGFFKSNIKQQVITEAVILILGISVLYLILY